MNLFNKKTIEPEPEDITGTEALRRLLKVRISRPGVSLGNIARDVNDGLATDGNRRTAREIATRMAGDGADEAVIRDVAKGVMNNLPSKPVGASVSESQLRDFIDGRGDLSPQIKTQLAMYFYTGPVTFDAEQDLLVQLNDPPVKPFATNIPGPWVNPDPKIAAAQKAYHQALRDARGPEPVRRKPSGEEPSGRLPKRAGFA